MFVKVKTAFFLGLFVTFITLISEKAQASTILLHRISKCDEAVKQFYRLAASSVAAGICSYGYANESTSPEVTVSSRGFSTIWTLFDRTGIFLTDNKNSSSIAVNPLARTASDTRMTATLLTSNYFVALISFAPFSIGWPADGFAEAGTPKFTSDSRIASGDACVDGKFRDISATAGHCCRSNCAMDFVNVNGVTPIAPVPKPGTVALLNAGLLGLALASRRKRYTLITIPVLLMAFFSAGARAQGPDYSNVDDFLNGKRTLLAIDDVVIAGINFIGPNLR
jgi:hypothetical protein